MLKWLLLGFIVYMFYKSAGPLLSLFKFNQSIKAKKHKIDIRSKIQKMDIQDAEFEESPDE
jgi:hypothetical protein